ncbi:MAG TPA: multidrug efflux RND transporter permease subunit [Thermoanaerobaculia bacterium]|jgi:HAE1 family hydrophobic/amphiphilic exporter-1|nr:multidrug efflux RND transporter permease subunit [Thermoanaerobaculia bacterium]
MSRFFIDRPIVAIVIAILTVLLGVVAMTGLPIAQFPQIIPPQIQIQTTYNGADAITVEQTVATPIEQQMNGVDNMLYMYSVNSSDGQMTLRVVFDVDTDVNIDQVNAINRVAQAQPNLPSDVNQFGLTYRKTAGVPMLLIALYSPRGTFDNLFLGNYALINVDDPLYRVPGVGQVLNFGAADYSMRIWVKPDQLAKLGLTVADLTQALQRQNTVNPSGQLGAEPAPAGQEFTYTVRALGTLVTPEQFGQVVVRLNPDGSVVRLRDVARIELGALNYKQIARLNGQPSSIIAIYQLPGSNALSVVKGVKEEMERLKQRFPNDLDYLVSLDTTVVITEGIREILTTLLEAIGLVLLVVFIFLQNWRATLIPLIAVPVSLIGTFAVFPLLGFSINTLSLFGLVLAIGLVVDDAIVVVEAVEHNIEEGMAPRDATIRAMEMVQGPVVAIALILASVFLPVALMSGIQGRLNKQFAVTIAISVLISAFNALSLSPALSAMLLKPRPKGEKRRGLLARFFDGFNRVFGKATDRYITASRFLIRKFALGLAILAAFAVLAFFLGRSVPGSFLPDEDQGYFFLNLQLPDASSLQRTDAACRKADAILAKTPGVGYYTTIAGFSLLSYVSASYYGFYFVGLKPWEQRSGSGQTAQALITKINQEVKAQIPEATAVFGFLPPAIPGLGAAGGFSLWLQDHSGGSPEYLYQNLQTFLTAARKRKELQNVNAVFRASVPQVFVDVDRDKVIKQGVPIGDVYQTLQAFLGAVYVNQFNRFGRQWRVFLSGEAESRANARQIDQYYVRNNDGTMVPLSALVTIRNIAGPEYTTRFNLFRSAQVTGSAAEGYSSQQAMAALDAVAKQALPSQMSYSWADLSYQEQKAAGTSGKTFALSLIFVFLILAALYESWSLPFSVLLSVPVAVFGAFAGLLLRHFDFDVYGQIGLVMLIGLAAKNAILIVEFAKDEFERGESLEDAALGGAKLRLRPILMTSFAFIFGCVPLWVASGAGAASRQILGTSVITGMLAATGFAIFLIPVLFVVVERISGAERRQRPKGEGPPPGDGPREERQAGQHERQEVREEAPVGAPG